MLRHTGTSGFIDRVRKHIFSGAAHDAVADDDSEAKLKAKTRELALMVEKLSETNIELEHFAYVASHDMQEPLRMIANFSGIIISEYYDKLDPQGREYLEIIKDSATRIQTMVRDLLDYARTGRDAGRFVTFNANDEFRHVLEGLAMGIADKHAEVTCDTLPHIKGNAVKFSRVLQNLIGNGLKYQSAGVAPRIHLGIQDRGNMWCFSVTDNGIGIAEQHLQDIFQPFRRLHSWQDYQGTGLGLSLCKNIVESHGGEIWAAAVEGRTGTCFYFTWPKNLKDSA